jgi:hypothetical protein
MVDSRGWCASALVLIAACSFPDYEVPPVGVTPTCLNAVRDGDEAGVDCGGSCKPCPVCSDGMRNGDEEAVDCGGSCDACPTCEDGLQNGSESDEDCGGTCSRCDTNQRCRESADCESLVCSSVCQPPDCNDRVRNGLETGVDCGGGCPGCENGSACEENDDCVSARCQGQICVAAGCTDGVVNGAETDTDCGGEECAPCAAPGKCEQERDCASLVCTSGTCSEASCEDKVQNQGESWPDCGGAACSACQIGEGCFVAADCVSLLCLRGTCVPENPSGQPLSKGSWTLSSSEGSTESGNAQVFDGDASTHWTSGAQQRAGMYVDLDLGKQTIFFKALLQVVSSPHEADFPGFIDVYVSTDGSFGEPTSPREQGNQWLWVDFEGPQVGRYLRFVITEPKARQWAIGEINVYN